MADDGRPHDGVPLEARRKDALGKLRHENLGLDGADRERLGTALRGGKAAVAALVDVEAVVPVQSILVGRGGETDAHELDEAALREAVDSAGT